MARGSISKLRVRLFEKQDGRCHYCDSAMVKTVQPHPDTVTVDHIIPACAGGTRIATNIVGACLTCNNARGSLPYDEFKALVARTGRPQSPILNNPGAWLKAREIKAARRARRRALLAQAAGKEPHMSADRPYLREIAKYPTMAEALSSAGLVPDELNENLRDVRERWST